MVTRYKIRSQKDISDAALVILGNTSGTNTGDNATNTQYSGLAASKADLASPTFTGTPSLPTGTTGVTQSANDNSTKIATTAYVDTKPGSIVGPDGITYGTVVAKDGKVWLDRNLGATQVATAFNDTNAYGYLYQWGRQNDGHQIRTGGNTATLSASDSVVYPNSGNFIKSSSSPYDWRSPQNDNLWQGTNGINNPCPAGFRLPTSAEWQALVTAEGITNSATAYSSSLKLTAAGYRGSSDASLYSLNVNGRYRSSSVSGTNALYLGFDASSVNPANVGNRAFGFTVRCLKD